MFLKMTRKTLLKTLEMGKRHQTPLIETKAGEFLHWDELVVKVLEDLRGGGQCDQATCVC